MKRFFYGFVKWEDLKSAHNLARTLSRSENYENVQEIAFLQFQRESEKSFLKIREIYD